MENLKKEDLIEKKEVTPAPEEKKDEVIVPKTDTSQPDPLKTELEKVQNRGGRSELEKASFSLKKNAERVKELGGEPDVVLGIAKEDSPDDDAPITVGMFKKLQAEVATKTATQLAGEIENETERELTLFHLNNSIKSTGNPNEDLRLARALVNDVKNRQILEEIARKNPPKTHSNASGVDAIVNYDDTELTPQEKLFMGKPFNMTKEAIIKTRKK